MTFAFADILNEGLLTTTPSTVTLLALMADAARARLS